MIQKKTILECPKCNRRDKLKFIGLNDCQKPVRWTYECGHCKTVFENALGRKPKAIKEPLSIHLSKLVACPKCESTAVKVKPHPLVYKYQCRKCRKIFASEIDVVIPEKPEKPKKPPGKNDILDVGGVKVSRRKAEFAKNYAETGDKRLALEASGSETEYPAQEAHKILKDPAVAHIVNKFREELRSVIPLSREEIKQLVTELAVVSPIDLLEEDGSFDIQEIKDKNLGRFIKEIEIEYEWSRSAEKAIPKYKLKGYSRLDAAKLLSTINQDEENKDLLIVQAICHLFTTHAYLNTDVERERVFTSFANRYRTSVDNIRENFNKFGQFYLPVGGIASPVEPALKFPENL